jgi:hypothetical protein
VECALQTAYRRITDCCSSAEIHFLISDKPNFLSLWSAVERLIQAKRAWLKMRIIVSGGRDMNRWEHVVRVLTMGVAIVMIVACRREDAAGQISLRAAFETEEEAEAHASAATQRHYSAYWDYILMQNALSGSPSDAVRATCIARGKAEIPAVLETAGQFASVGVIHPYRDQLH